MNNIYQIHIDTPPPGAEDRETWQAMVRELTGADGETPTHFVQASTQDDSHRLTIAVPEDDDDLNRNLARAGHLPEFAEPDTPVLDQDSVIIPTTFQLSQFGAIIDPRSISNNPQRQALMAEALMEALPDLPDPARNFLHWTAIDQDESGVATLSWHDPRTQEPDPQETTR